MKRVIVYGTAVLALSGAPLLAQQSSPGSSSPQPSTTGAQGGSTAAQPAPRSGQQSGSQPGSPAPGAAQGASRQSAGALGNADRQFIMEAAHGGLAEVELGRMASTKAQSPQVKQFGQKMVDDHGKANQELKTLAQNKSVTLPTELDAKHKATKDRLEKLSGAEFDRAYMQEMVSDHQKTVSDFRKQSQSGQDPDVKAWAAKSLPILEQHYQMAQQASRGAVGTSGSQSSSPGSNAPGTRGTTGGQTPRGGSDDASGGANTGTPRSGGSGTSGSGAGGSTSGSGSGSTPR